MTRRHRMRGHGRPRELGRLLREAFSRWSQDNAQRMGAALAYYTVLSVAPLLVIVISLVGLVLGPEAAQGLVVARLGELMGEGNALMLQNAIQRLDRPEVSTVAGGVAALTMVLAATGALGELRASLNQIWRVTPRRGPLLRLLWSRLLSLLFLFCVGFVLLASLGLSAAASALGKYFAALLPIPAAALQAVNFGVSFLVVTLLFAMIFKLLPEARVPWHDVWLGAAVTSALFLLGNFLLGLYLGRSSFASAYGAAGSLVLFLVWTYYSAQILLFGAEFTRVTAETHGRTPAPEAKEKLTAPQ